MGPMHRRTVIKSLAVAAGATSLAAACSAPPTTRPAPANSAAGPAARPAFSLPTNATSAGKSPGAKPATAPSTAYALTTTRLALHHGPSRPLPTTIWQPTGDGPFPLILFSHGLTAAPADYRELLSTWAEAGFVVAAPAYPHTAKGVADYNPIDVLNQPADASAVLTEVLRRLEGRIDPGKVAAAGHSAGGITTLGLLSARDARIRAAVVLAGRQIVTTPLSGAPAPILFVHGRQDRTVRYADGRAAYNAVTWPKAFLTVTAGGHVASGRSLDVIATTSTDFWRWTLYGDPAAKSRIPADATRGRLATLTDQL
jgi:dienelactone hydrolase